MQALDLLALDARLEGKVKLRQRLDGRQARGAHGGLQATVVAQRDLGAQHQLDRFAAVTAPLSTLASTPSTASSAPGIFRSASIARSRSRRSRAVAVIPPRPHRPATTGAPP